MKKITTFILAIGIVSSISLTAFANTNTEINTTTEAEITFSQEPHIGPDGEIIPGLIPVPDDYPVPAVFSSSRVQPDGYFINADGVAARRPYGLSSPIIGRLYTGDVIWTHWETARADGYTWLHVDTADNSNMKGTPDVWIVTDYVGSPWSLEEEQ